MLLVSSSVLTEGSVKVHVVLSEGHLGFLLGVALVHQPLELTDPMVGFLLSDVAHPVVALLRQTQGEGP